MSRADTESVFTILAGSGHQTTKESSQHTDTKVSLKALVSRHDKDMMQQVTRQAAAGNSYGGGWCWT